MIRTATFAKTLALSLAALAAAGAMPAAARTAPVETATVETPRAEMDIAHVDFTSPRAVKSLKAQLRRVAAKMCTPFNDGTIHMTTEEMQCYNTAVKDGLAQIESRRQLALARAAQTVVAANTELRPAH